MKNVVIVLMVLISFSSCESLFDNTELIEDSLVLEITNEKDVKYLELETEVGTLHKLTFVESTTSSTHEKSVLNISLFDTDEDFWESENEYNAVYDFRNDNERKIVVYFVPNKSPFFVKIDPFLDFYGSVNIQLEKNVVTQKIILDGEMHEYEAVNDVKDDTFYVILEMETESGSTYAFDVQGGGFNDVYNDINETHLNSIYSDFDYVAEGAKAFLVKERYSWGSTSEVFELSVIKK